MVDDLNKKEQDALLDSGGAGDTIDSARNGESVIPFEPRRNSRSNGFFGRARNLVLGRGKITKNQALLGGGSILIIIMFVLTGGAILTAQPIHYLKNAMENFGFGDSVIAKRIKTIFRGTTYDNGYNSTRTRSREKFFGISENRAQAFRDNGFELNCNGHSCGDSPDDTNIFKRYKTTDLEFIDVSSGQTYSYNDLKSATDEGVFKNLNRVYHRLSSWVDTKAQAFFMKNVQSLEARTGLRLRDADSGLSQAEANVRISEQIADRASARNTSQGGVNGRTVDLDENNNSVGEGQSLAERIPGLQEAIDYVRTTKKTATLSPELKKIIVDEVSSVNLLNAITGAACGIYSIIDVGMQLAATTNRSQNKIGATSINSSIEAIYDGTADSKVISAIMTPFNTSSQYDEMLVASANGDAEMVSRMLTSSEAPAFDSVVNGKSVKPDTLIGQNLSYSTLNSWITTNSGDAPGLLAYLGQDVQDFCRAVQSPLTQIGIIVGIGVIGAITAITAIPSGGASVGIASTIVTGLSGAATAIFGSNAVAIAISVALPTLLPMAINTILPPLIGAMVGNQWEVDIDGASGVTKWAAGTTATISDKDQYSGTLIATTDSLADYSAEYQDYLAQVADEERKSFGPFDARSTHTFIGSLFDEIIPELSSLSSPSGFLGGIGHLFHAGIVGLAPSVKAADDFANLQARVNNNHCPTIDGKVIATTIFCDAVHVTHDKNILPWDALQSLVDAREAEVVQKSTGELESKVHKVKYSGVGTDIFHNGVKTETTCGNTRNHNMLYDGFYDENNYIPNEVESVSGATAHNYETWTDGEYTYQESYETTIKNCSVVTDLYKFQKTYKERGIAVGGISVPSPEIDDDGNQVDSDEIASGFSPWSIITNFLGIDQTEKAFQFKSLDKNNPETFNFTNEDLKGKIGIDDGTDWKTYLSLFFIDRDIDEGINGSTLRGGTVAL